MTPKEQAQEIYNKHQDSISALEGSDWWESAKRCALISVDEIIKSNPHSNPMNTKGFSTMAYWMEVKHEIINL